jgi:hypothetical protein
MIKFHAIDKEDGFDIVGIVLDDNNLRELKLGHPIGFPCQAVGIPGKMVVVAYKNEEAKQVAANPYPTITFMFLLGDEALEKLKTGEEYIQEIPGKRLRFHISWTEDLDKVLREMQAAGCIDENTVVRRDGFSPSDEEPIWN